jgi:DNA replication and repair protein RecF
LKSIGSGGFYISSSVSCGKWVQKLEIEYEKSRKSLEIDGISVPRASDFVGRIKPVAFSPSDINIVTGNSGLRRRFIDIFVSMDTPGYLSSLSRYMVALRSRNAVLRMPSPDVNAVKAYEPLLADNAVNIINIRDRYSAMLEDEVNRILKEYFSSSMDFKIKYRNNSNFTDIDSYISGFDFGRKKDLVRKFTCFGPQLDEFDFILNSKLLKNYGSTGQCRLISLCLKMAEVNILSKPDGRKNNVTVLVDDVTGELDSRSRDSFFKIISGAGQMFFTFTECPDDSYFREASFFEIGAGGLISKL